MDIQAEGEAPYAALQTDGLLEAIDELCNKERHDVLLDLLTALDIITLPSKDLATDHKAFVANILQQCDRLTHKLELFKTPELAQKFLSMLDTVTSEIAAAMPASKNGPRRMFKPWHMYLYNKAPGARHAFPSHVSSAQVMPPAASRLLLMWSQQDAEVQNAIQQTNPGGPSFSSKDSALKFCWDPRVAKHPYHVKTIPFDPASHQKKKLAKYGRPLNLTLDAINLHLARVMGANPPQRRPNRFLTNMILRARRVDLKSGKEANKPA